MALRGIKVLEMAGLAPVPYCGQVLRDFGAEVIRVDRAGTTFQMDQQSRGKRSIALNMKHPAGQDILHKLVEKSDIIVDPFRPGVMERMNCGPDKLMEVNKGLIYARLSGFGQTGPLQFAPGHDINYIAQAGVLDALRDDRGKPQPPVNLIADFAGGGMLLTTGIMAALYERTVSGQGAAYAAGFFWAMRSRLFPSAPGTNMLDGGPHFYGCYETSDNRWMAVGSIEPQFYAVLIHHLGMGDEIDLADQMDQSLWKGMKKRFETRFAEKTQAEWVAIFSGTEACCTPVLTAEEAANDEHNRARGVFMVDDHDTTFPVAVPHFSRTEHAMATSHPDVGGDTRALLTEMLQIDPDEVENFFQSGAVS